MKITLQRYFLVCSLFVLNLAFVYAEEPSAKPPSDKPVVEQLVDTLEKLAGGPHAGKRANHAKGILVRGSFMPATSAATLSRAVHLQGKATPVVVRFSDATGVPDIADADPHAFPKGMAIRFQLADNKFTDIVVISVDRFPAATPEGFLEFLNAIAASGPDAQTPTPIEQYLASHAAARAFVDLPKPPPESFATQPFHGINAFKFINAEGKSHYGRYLIEPLAGEKFLDAGIAAKAAPDYLMDEFPTRLAGSPVKFRISVQLAGPGDEVNDDTVVWPRDRPVVELGTVTLNEMLPDAEAFAKATMFNPLALVDGIEPSNDPVLLARPGAYTVSFGRRLSNP
jgi:catalase